MTNQQRATYLPLIEAVDRYAERNAVHLTESEVISALKEIRERLDRQYARLIELNEILREGSVPKIEYDLATETFQVKDGTQEARSFKIPGISGPLRQIAGADITPFEAGVHSTNLPIEHAPLRLELEELLEAYYYGAHRLTVLVRKLPNLKKYSCKAMIVVRNDLIEHTKEEHNYAFGYGTGGPFVRPVRIAGDPPKDQGAVANTTAFIESLNSVFQSS
jgi:hypothetical protein